MNIPDDQTNRRILVIDDNRSIHNSFRAIVHGAESGKNALDEAEARLFGEVPSVPRAVGFTMESAYQGEEASSCYGRRSIKASPTPWHSSICECRPGWMASKR